MNTDIWINIEININKNIDYKKSTKTHFCVKPNGIYQGYHFMFNKNLTKSTKKGIMYIGFPDGYNIILKTGRKPKQKYKRISVYELKFD